MSKVTGFKLKQVSITLTIVALVWSQLAAAQIKPLLIKSNSEGAVSSQHIQSFNKYRTKYFYTNGKIDLKKLAELEQFLSLQKEQLMYSAKMNKKTNLILVHGADQEEAEAKGLKAQNEQAEAIAPFIFAQEHITDLKNNLNKLTDSQITEKVETILLFLSAGYTPYPTGIFTSAADRLTNLARNFFDFKIDDSNQVQASNLINPETGRFLSADEIKQMQQQGRDISQLNPPSSAFWSDNKIEDYDPNNEIYFDEQLFPAKSVKVPVFYYKRMGNGNIKIKTEWVDEHDLNKKGKPKKKDVTIRLGHEAYATPISSHFARIIGYPANPNTFRSKIKLVLGDKTFNQFVNEWTTAHGVEQGSPLTHIERIPGENAVYIKNANLEAYPDEDKYRKMGPFRMGDNGFGNRREYRAMVLLNALISLQDQFEYQSRVDAYRKKKDDLWSPIFFISDVGQSLGIPTWGNTGTVNEYTWNFTWTDRDEIKLFWISIFNHRTWEKTTYSDVKWLARRIARISPQQIEGILKASGIPAPAQALYAEKIKSRINKMAADFNLNREGFRAIPVRSVEQLSRAYPTYIDNNGYLKVEAQQIKDNSVPILGNQFTPWQFIKTQVFTQFSNALSKIIVNAVLTQKLTEGGLIDLDLGKSHVDSGKIFEASRKVSVNNEVGPTQRRYLIRDRLSVGLPLGLSNDHLKTPASLYSIFSFEYVHSVDNLNEIVTNNFFKRLNPFQLTDIRNNLKQGEQLYISHNFGASIGEIKLKALDQLQIEAALLGVSTQTIKTMYFTKSETLLESYVTDYTGMTIKSGLDARAAIRFALTYQKNKSNQTRRYYQLDLLNKSDEEVTQLNTAFDLALEKNDFSQMNNITSPLTVKEASKSSSFDFGFILWNRDSVTSASEIQIGDKTILLAGRNVHRDRSFDRIWNDKQSGVGISLLNVFGNLTNEGEMLDVAFEGSLDANKTNFSRIEVNLNFAKSDRYTKRKEFFNEFIKFFNDRAGQDQYIKFDVPQEIEQYQNLAGLMRWQLSEKAVIDLLTAMTQKENLSHITVVQDQKHHNDRRDMMVSRARRLLEVLENKNNKSYTQKQLAQAAKGTVELLEDFIGSKGKNAGLIRKHVADKDLWVITSIKEMLDLTNPTFRLRNDYWAPEIGQFQGHSELDVFRRTQLRQPILLGQ